MRTIEKIPGFPIDTPAKIYYLPLEKNDNISSIAEKTGKFLGKTGFSKLVQEDSIVALKQHFGEKGNYNYLKPEISKSVVEFIKNQRACPILVDTNTLYKGNRSDAYHHLMLAHEHGFSIESTGAPVFILDGLNGQNYIPVDIPGNHFKKVYMAPDIPFFDSMFILSHVKGHMLSSMGGALKNLAMGFSSRAGKLAQHDDFRPEVVHKKCIQCLLCLEYCPVNAIELKDNKIQTDYDKCIGCGECYAACKNGAIEFNWESKGRIFQEKMTEHALGAVIKHAHKVAYVNFVYDISKHCDCWGEDNPVIYGNVCILASYDPVAIDKASLDLSRKKFGKDIFKEMWPELNPLIQIEYGESIGLGTQDYELVEVCV